MQDFSFLRLKPTFAEAKNMGDQKQSDPKLRRYDCIALHPLESCLQITNSEVDIVFDNDYKVSLIDCAENEIKDITANVKISEFVNQETGIKNIAFEIVSIGESFTGKDLYLKFEHTTGTEVFYSNAFWVIEDNVEETFRLVYSSYGYYEGVDYENAPYFQTIRLRGQFEEQQDQTEQVQYKQQSGNTISKRSILSISEGWRFNDLNTFTFERLAVALKSDIVYMDGFRSTDLPVLKNGNRKGATNLSDAEATIYRDKNDEFNDVFQITPVFGYVELFPVGAINNDIISSNPLRIILNKPVTLGTGFLRIFREDGTQEAILNQLDFTQADSTTIESTANLEDYISILHNYYVLFEEGLFLSDIGETISITNNMEWTFQSVEGDFLSTDFLNADFLIHS